MIIKEWGVEHPKKLLFLPGAFSDYQWYIPSVELLSKKWHVLVPIYDGYHEPYENSFTSVEFTAQCLIDFFKVKKIQEFEVVYGLCMGGVIANLLYATSQLQIDALIIDAGIAPYKLPHWITRVILLRDVMSMKMLCSSKQIIKLVFPPKRWLYPWETEEDYWQSMTFLKKLTNKTIRNCFDSCNNYIVPKSFPSTDTKIYYFYGELERKQRASDIQFFVQNYPNLIVREFTNRDHGELATLGYQEFAQVIYTLIE